MHNYTKLFDTSEKSLKLKNLKKKSTQSFEPQFFGGDGDLRNIKTKTNLHMHNYTTSQKLTQ